MCEVLTHRISKYFVFIELNIAKKKQKKGFKISYDFNIIFGGSKTSIKIQLDYICGSFAFLVPIKSQNKNQNVSEKIYINIFFNLSSFNNIKTHQKSPIKNIL